MHFSAWLGVDVKSLFLVLMRFFFGLFILIYLFFSGKIHYTEIFDLLRSIDPPLGFGKKCPERQTYKKLIRMNMPMDKEGKVSKSIFFFQYFVAAVKFFHHYYHFWLSLFPYIDIQSVVVKILSAPQQRLRRRPLFSYYHPVYC